MDKSAGTGLPPKFSKQEMEKQNKQQQKRMEPKQKTQEEKNQIDIRARGNEKKWEKPVADLDAEEKQAPMKKQQPSKDKSNTESERKKSESESNDMFKDDKTDEKNSEKDSEGNKREGIKISIFNKGTMKPIQTVGAAIKKVNPLLPPWESLPNKQDSNQKSHLAKSAQKPDTGKTPSLGKFLNMGSKPLPVVKDDGKQKFTAQDILKKVSGKEKEKDIKTKEDLEEMKMLGIDTNDEKPLALKKAPPPPSSNLYLPTTPKVDERAQGIIDALAGKKETPVSAIPKSVQITSSTLNVVEAAIKPVEESAPTISLDSIVLPAPPAADKIPLPENIPIPLTADSEIEEVEMEDVETVEIQDVSVSSIPVPGTPIKVSDNEVQGSDLSSIPVPGTPIKVSDNNGSELSSIPIPATPVKVPDDCEENAENLIEDSKQADNDSSELTEKVVTRKDEDFATITPYESVPYDETIPLMLFADSNGADSGGDSARALTVDADLGINNVDSKNISGHESDGKSSVTVLCTHTKL